MNRCPLIVVMLCATAASFAEGPLLSGGVLRQENITRSDRRTDELDDTFLRLDAAQAWSGALNRDWRWDAQVRGAGEAGFEYTDLNQVATGGDAGLTYKAGLGPYAPRGRAGAGADYAWFDDSRRSRILLTPELRLTQRLHDGVVSELFIRHERADADEALFDARANVAGLMIQWAVGARGSLMAGYQYRDGDVTSFAGGRRPDLAAVADVTAPEIDAFDRTLFAYRLDARTHVVQFGGAVALRDRWSVEALCEWQQTEARALSYDVQLFQLGVRAAL